MIVVAAILPVERPMRLAVHDRRGKASECIQTSTLPEDFARYRKQRTVRVAHVTDGVTEAVSGCTDSLNETWVEPSIGISKVVDGRLQARLEDLFRFNQFLLSHLYCLARQKQVRFRV